MKMRLFDIGLCAAARAADIELRDEAVSYKRVEAGQEWDSFTATRNGSQWSSTRTHYLATLSPSMATYTHHRVWHHETE